MDQAMAHTAKTVLVIEDNDQNRMLSHALLEAKGYSVLEAATGMEGWRIAHEQHPDIILMDIQLPDISGLEVANWLKNDKSLETIPVVAVTILEICRSSANRRSHQRGTQRAITTDYRLLKRIRQ